MATYAIGDIQGCFFELGELLKLIQFDSKKDKLWFAGDLVSRGPKSLESLRFVKSLQEKGSAITVLGNHDIHLLKSHFVEGGSFAWRDDETILEVLSAEDAPELMAWLRRQPLLYHDDLLGYLLTHAGIFPYWSISEAKQYANEIEKVLKEGDLKEILPLLYGDFPDEWSDDLRGWDRLRFILNVFTRMRFCTRSGKLDFKYKGPPGDQPETLLPWFQVSSNIAVDHLFGHWSALEGKTGCEHFFALDGGCVWGRNLMAMRLEDKKTYTYPKV